MSDILEIQSHCSEVDDHESMPVTFSQKGSPKTALIPGPSEKLVFSAKRRKGRGFDGHCDSELDNIKHFDSLVYDPIKKEDHPQKSVEGWVLFVTGLHEEANEDDVRAAFSEYGNVTNIAVNIDRRTGFLKGYALVEYKMYEEAFKAKENLDESTLLDRQITVNWGFVQKPLKKERRFRYNY